MTLPLSLSLKRLVSIRFWRKPTERRNEKTRQKAGFSGVSEILKAFSGTLYGAGTKNRTRDLLITSQLLYQLSYTGVMGGEYIEFFGSVNPSCLIRFKKILRSRLRPRLSRQPWLASAGGLEFWK